MKKQVRTISGEIETKELQAEGQLFGFFVGDIITCQCGECDWDAKYVLVIGFDYQNQRLYGIQFDGVEIDYDVLPQENFQKQKLMIVQRNTSTLYSLKQQSMETPPELKVGDKIIVTSGEGEGYQGKVVVINKDLINLYLVELFGYQQGDKNPDYYTQILNPKALPSSCIFKEACGLALLSDLGQKISKKQTVAAKEQESTPEEKATLILFWYLEQVFGKKDKNYPLMNQSLVNQAVELKVKAFLQKQDLEQFLGQIITDSARVALRELGIFLYEMLTGHSEKTDVSFRLDGYPAIQTYSPDVSQKFSRIIQQMIAGYFRNPEALRDAFENQKQIRDISERDISEPEETVQSIPRPEKILEAKNILDPEAVIKTLSAKGLEFELNREEKANFQPIPFSKEILKTAANYQRKGQRAVLWWAPPQKYGITIIKLRELFGVSDIGNTHQPCIYNNKWWLKKGFAKDILREGWHLTFIKDKVFEIQYRDGRTGEEKRKIFLTEKKAMLAPVEVVYLWLVNYLINNEERLLDNDYPCTHTVDSDGKVVSLVALGYYSIDVLCFVD